MSLEDRMSVDLHLTFALFISVYNVVLSSLLNQRATFYNVPTVYVSVQMMQQLHKNMELMDQRIK